MPPQRHLFSRGCDHFHGDTVSANAGRSRRTTVVARVWLGGRQLSRPGPRGMLHAVIQEDQCQTAETWSIHLGRQLGVDLASVEADVQQRLRNIPK